MADTHAPPERKPNSSPYALVLGNPEAVFRAASYGLAPVIWGKYLVLPIILLGLIGTLSNWYELRATLERVLISVSFLQGMLLGMLSSNLLSKLRQGLAMARLSIPPTQFGIRLLFGLIPRFFVNVALVRRLNFGAQSICYLTPLLTKLWLSAFGVIVWILTRHSGSDLSSIALALSSTGFGAFLFTVNPLFQADGYKLLTCMTKMPDLREQAFRTIGLVIRRKPLPPQMSSTRFWAMILYGAGCVLFTTFFLLFIVTGIAISLRTEFNGAGVVMFCVLVGLVIVYLRSRRKPKKSTTATTRGNGAPNQRKVWHSGSNTGKSTLDREGVSMKPDRTEKKEQTNDAHQPDTSAETDLDLDLESILPRATAKPTEDDELEDILNAALPTAPAAPEVSKVVPVPAIVPNKTPPAKPASMAVSDAQTGRPIERNLDAVLPLAANKKKKPGWIRACVWLAIIGIIFLIATRPYQFSVGGEFVVQPVEPTQVRARMDGEIDRLLVSEGDWVKRDDVLAVLSNWETKRDIAVQDAELEKLKAELATLIAGPKDEEVALAEQELAANEAQVTLAQQTLDRQETLYASRTISLKSVEQARGEYNVAKAEREKAQARLELLKTGALDSEVAAAQAQINRKEQELNFSKLRLEHTNIRAVSEGQIVSSLSGITVGSFLKEGDLFAEIADNRVVRAEIEVPETEIDEVEIGAEVTLRPWSAPDTGIIGSVMRIAPSAQGRDFGKVVRVIVEVQNAESKLAGEMTGFAKVFVDERPVWQAFGRVFERFFLIEMWSWVP